MTEYRFKIGNFAPTGAVDPKFQVKGVAAINHFPQKARLNDLSYGIKIWTDFSSVSSQFTRFTDGQTDGRTERILIARPCLHSMQRGKKLSCCEQIDTVVASDKAVYLNSIDFRKVFHSIHRHTLDDICSLMLCPRQDTEYDLKLLL